MGKLTDQLNAIETEHADFFTKSGKRIADYITQDQISSGIFINTDLPIEITAKIRKVFDAIAER